MSGHSGTFALNGICDCPAYKGTHAAHLSASSITAHPAWTGWPTTAGPTTTEGADD